MGESSSIDASRNSSPWLLRAPWHRTPEPSIARLPVSKAAEKQNYTRKKTPCNAGIQSNKRGEEKKQPPSTFEKRPVDENGIREASPLSCTINFRRFHKSSFKYNAPRATLMAVEKRTRKIESSICCQTSCASPRGYRAFRVIRRLEQPFWSFRWNRIVNYGCRPNIWIPPSP